MLIAMAIPLVTGWLVAVGWCDGERRGEGKGAGRWMHVEKDGGH
jgi:hypothetical protein